MPGENILTNATEQGGAAKHNYADEIYDIRLNDPKEGVLIPADILTELYINEDMFSLLPSFVMKFQDKGAFFNSVNLKTGDRLYIKITPNIETEGKEPKYYINGEYCIQSINCLPDLSTSVFRYTINGIFNAQRYLNEVDTYPHSNSILDGLVPDLKTSVDIIHEVLDDTPLKFLQECETRDLSLWLNCNDTRAQFIEKIVEHAWIAEDDAPLLYTDLFGQAHYTSVKTLAAKKKMVKFVSTKIYCQKSGEEEPELTMLFGDCNLLNASGPILNQGGYKIKEAYYTPYNFWNLLDDDITFSDMSIEKLIADIMIHSDASLSDIAIAQLNDIATYGKYRVAEYKQDDSYIAPISNKDASQMNTLTKFVDCGMHFKDYHNHYDLAPRHNEMIRRSFFQNFVNLVVDVHRLPDAFKTAKCRPVLGDKIQIDFNVENNIDPIHSGNYIICGIRHCFRKGNSYSMEMKAVTDGTFGKGVIVQ